MPITPSTHRQRLGAGVTGLSSIPGLITSTPVGFQGRTRQPLRESQSNQRPGSESLAGVGLSSRLKTSQGPSVGGTFVSPVRPRGKRHHLPSASLCMLSHIQLYIALEFLCLAQHLPSRMV